MPRIVESLSPRRPTYFWWLLANVLALCFAVISWAVCLHVFGHPEMPRNYEILRKIGRLPQIKRFTVLDAPNGSVLDPPGLYRRFSSLTNESLVSLNSQLMRNYLTNFPRTQTLTYIEGDYQLGKIRQLRRGDFIPNGFAVRARALVKPDDFSNPAPYPVLIEYVVPTKDPAAARNSHPGDILTVKRNPNCAAIVHVAKVTEANEQLVVLTVVPLACGPGRLTETTLCTIEPPLEIRPAAGFPIFKP